MFLIFIILVIVFASSFFLSKHFSLFPNQWTPLDQPNSRSLHTSPTPRTGGIAIFASLSIGLLALFICIKLGFFLFSYQEVPFKKIVWILGIFSLILAVSFWDDRKNVSPIIRLGVQLIGSLGIVWGDHLSIDHLTFPHLGSISLGLLSVPITVLLILWMTNLYNFMDGMDGFAGGMTIFGFSLLSYFFWRGESFGLAIISALTAFSTGGFFLHNLPPAKIFMGDMGSITLGFLSGVLIITGIKKEIFDLWLPIIIFSPFIIDSTVTLFKRVLKQKKFWISHRDHYYQRLVLAGWGHRKTVLAEYFLMVFSGVLALLYSKVNQTWKMTILLFLFLIYTFLILAVSVLNGNSKEIES